ncbi:MAG TPA: hypothetical protein VKR22_03875 [Acidimicrobiales bacterium]|nr:hypothetical protein [Acidimicrobiales bacterium]
MASAPRALVLCPMRSELRPVLRLISARPSTLGASPVHTGTSGSTDVTAAMIGVGPAAAREATQRLLDSGSFDHVVVSGIAGGIGPDLEVGDLVTPAELEDLATGKRFTPTVLGPHQAAGTIATTHELILDDDRLRELVDRGIVGLDMESSAVAEVCEARGLPCSIFRVVSDRPQDGLLEPGVMDMLQADGTINAPKALKFLVTHPHRMGPLIRLGRDAGAATRRAARHAVAACATLAGSAP